MAETLLEGWGFVVLIFSALDSMEKAEMILEHEDEARATVKYCESAR